MHLQVHKGFALFFLFQTEFNSHGTENIIRHKMDQISVNGSALLEIFEQVQREVALLLVPTASCIVKEPSLSAIFSSEYKKKKVRNIKKK